MARKLVGVMAAAAMAVLAITSGNAADEKPKTIKDVMKATANKKSGLPSKISEAAKAGKWDDAVTQSKELVALAADLSKNKPPKGEAEAWKTHTDLYSVTAKSFLTASEKKDADGVAAAGKAFGTACMACHKEHKGK